MNKKAHLFAACIAATLTMVMPPARAGHDSPQVIVEWNQLLQANIPSNAGLLVPRYYAMLHVAMFDAANAIEREYTPYHARLLANPEDAPASLCGRAIALLELGTAPSDETPLPVEVRRIIANA